MNQSALQPIWDWMLRIFGADFFAFPLYFLPVVVAVVLLTGVGSRSSMSRCTTGCRRAPRRSTG